MEQVSPLAGRAVPELPATDADVVLRLDLAGRLLAASPTAEQVLGWSLGPGPAPAVTDGVLAAVEDVSERAALQALAGQLLRTGTARGTVQLTCRDGRRWLDVAARRLPTSAGGPVHVCARDVTEEMASSAHVLAAEQQWRVAFEHSPIGGALLDEAGGVLISNDALCTMLGWRPHELARMHLGEVLGTDGPGTDASWHAWWSELLANRVQGGTLDTAVRTADGRHLWARLSGASVPRVAGPRHVMLQVQDVTERHAAELELADRALHDGLTSLPNRFLTRQWLVSALEDQPGACVGVLYCDLDRFKPVNDSLGHAAGDDLLREVGERLREPLRPEDLVGRVGGDEFVVVLENVTTPAQLAEVAGRLAAALDEPVDLGGQWHTMTLSIGGALGIAPDTADEVLVRADLALLRAKRSGRARFEMFDPAVDRVATRADLQLEDELRTSLHADELRAHYQPVVALHDLSVVGHEALVRWQHPGRGLLPPSYFLELAETSGLIRPLGWWMLRQACKDAARGTGGLGPAPQWIAVNASPNQLTRPGVADEVLEALRESGLRPERLHLEITETALITANATLVRELRELSESGVRIALDDFGTGYSSLSLLRQFPVDMVKVDRSFVEPLLEDRSAHAIVKAVLGMCHDLGLPTVAEGIERPDQLEVLRELGCSHGQGFLFGHPQPLPMQVKRSPDAAPAVVP